MKTSRYLVFVLYVKDYTLEGEFGKATDNFTDTGRVLEKTTYGNVYNIITSIFVMYMCIIQNNSLCLNCLDHVTQDKLERVLAMIQGANQKALIT